MWREINERKSIPWQAVEGFGDGTLCARDVGTLHRQKSMGWSGLSECRKRKSRKAHKVGGTWSPPFKEVLEQLQKHSDTSCSAYMTRRAYYAGRSGSREGFKEAFRDTGEISEWAFAGVKAAFDKVASEDVGRLIIAQDILRKSTDVLGRIVARASGVGDVTLSYVFPYCNCFPLEDCTWSSSGLGDGSNRKKKQCRWWCAACGGQYDERAPNRPTDDTSVSANAHEAKAFKAHAAPQGLCDNLVNALKLLTNQQKDGVSPLESIVTGLREKSREGIMEGAQKLHRSGQPQGSGCGRPWVEVPSRSG